MKAPPSILEITFWYGGGAILVAVGLLLSSTGCGMVIGIPCLLVAIPMIFVGSFRSYQLIQHGQKEAIRQGIVEASHARHPTVGCTACGEMVSASAQFCGKCGAPTPTA